MSVRQVKVHGRKVWQARVAFQGLRSSRVCTSRDAAKRAQAELLQELKRRAGQAEQAGLAPATFRQLFDAYAEDLEARGKGEDTIARAVQPCAVLEALLPDLLAKPVSRITEADILAFRRARAERPCFTPRPRDPEQKPARPPAPAKPSTINRTSARSGRCSSGSGPTSTFRPAPSSPRMKPGSAGSGPTRN
jgi:hypothetical protein